MITRMLQWALVFEIFGALVAWALGGLPWEIALAIAAVCYVAWVAATEAAIVNEPRNGIEYGVVRLWPTRRMLVWARHGFMVEWEVVRGG